ncbi:hypothetical protein SH661x_003017 [Planctomicrobium sp. SH661]|uniref:hypothetical protein n=1 Tax=Planctomicrobium sp. SH661 TaxID=3448124 RepID=UPI003F5C512C
MNPGLPLADVNLDPSLSAPFPETCNRLPLAPIETFLLRNDSPAHPMVFRVLLQFDGPVNRDLLTSTFDMAIARQPLLRSIVRSEGDSKVWTLADSIPTLQWRTGNQSPEEIVQTPIQPIRLAEVAGVRCEVCPFADGIIILLDIHHACCDGQGARQFLSEWLANYHTLHTSDRPKLTPLEFGQLATRAGYRLPTPPIGTWEGLRNLFLTVRGRTIRLKEVHPQSTAPDHLCEQSLSPDQTARLRECLKRNRFSINDIGLCASFLAFTECLPQASRRGFITLMHPVDLRWPSDLRTPACNRVGVSFLRRKRSACRNPQKLLQGLRDEMKYIKQRYVGAEFLRGLAATEKTPGLTDRIQGWGWFVPTLQFTCLGDTTRAMHHRFNQDPDGVINLAGMRLDRISGFMQLGSFLPLSIAACETNERLTLTARASSQHFDLTEAQQFLSVFVEKMIQSGTDE